ncbi:hypothetical protein OF83DRAFT_1154535, partial [Amylostereum chailletii]
MVTHRVGGETRHVVLAVARDASPSQCHVLDVRKLLADDREGVQDASACLFARVAHFDPRHSVHVPTRRHDRILGRRLRAIHIDEFVARRVVREGCAGRGSVRQLGVVDEDEDAHASGERRECGEEFPDGFVVVEREGEASVGDVRASGGDVVEGRAGVGEGEEGFVGRESFEDGFDELGGKAGERRGRRGHWGGWLWVGAL